MAGIFTALALALILALWVARVREKNRDGEWHWGRTNEMRRWVNGRWEIRPMTEEEAYEKQDREAW